MQMDRTEIKKKKNQVGHKHGFLECLERYPCHDRNMNDALSMLETCLKLCDQFSC